MITMLLGALLVAGAGAAGAQSDPYGSTSSTAPGQGPEPSCGLLTDLEAGGLVVVEVVNTPVGETVQLFLDGDLVASETAVTGQSAGAPVLLGGVALAAQAADVVDVELSFVLPEDLAPGTHNVTAVAGSFTRPCGQIVTQVAGVTTGGDAGGSTTGTDSGAGGRGLARTGVYAGLLVAVALALVLAGRAFQEAGRRRRRAARIAAGARRRSAVHQHADA